MQCVKISLVDGSILIAINWRVTYFWWNKNFDDFQTFKMFCGYVIEDEHAISNFKDKYFQSSIQKRWYSLKTLICKGKLPYGTCVYGLQYK